MSTASILLHQFFESTADTHPARTAVVFGGQAISYRELDQRSNQLARFLMSRGIGRGDCVGLLLARLPGVFAGFVAVLKAGGAYGALDASYPVDRVRFILSDCQARAVVTTRSLAKGLAESPSENARQSSRLPGGRTSASVLDSSDPHTRSGETPALLCGEAIVLDGCKHEIKSLPPDRCDPARGKVMPEDLCYIIYTSGSTGRPKGVQIEHRSVCHLVQAEAEIFRVQPEDRIYQGFTIAFDAAVEEVWLAFYAGATLVAARDDMARAGPALPRMLSDSGVTVLSCVPTLLAMMEEDVPGLRLLILGGEVCLPELVKRWWRPCRRVVNTYGPTEATVIATWTECHPAKAVTIGKPVAGYSACILNEVMEPAPPGEAGELCLGGVGLARGYVGLPELTREKFIIVPGTGVERWVSSIEEGPPDSRHSTLDTCSWN